MNTCWHNEIEYTSNTIMFTQSRNIMQKKLEEEFSKPVESIMRCEDFKSNFARRLSNRYISRSPVSSPKQDTALKLRPQDGAVEAVPHYVPERIELGSQLSKKNDMEQNGESVKPPDKVTFKTSEVQKTEVTVLNMEVETLRWQLAQTEANRQMHIALLKQIVAFLNRVKEHIKDQNNEIEYKQEDLPKKILPRSFNVADLPRSRSVVHVNKNAEYFLTTPKKISGRKISKSISNVNAFKDCNNIWNQSKLSLRPEIDASQKISEEMSRLITLANTVLSTKLPDLACSCGDKKYDLPVTKLLNIDLESDTASNKSRPDSNSTLDQIQEDAATFFALNTVENYTDDSDIVSENGQKVSEYDAAGGIKNRLENTFPDINLMEKEDISMNERVNNINDVKNKSSVEKRNNYNCTNFIEDESGFSSMSSFQEIGIPIISIIPPSPCKELGFLEEIPDLIEETERWKTDTSELEKQPVKVFWV